MTSDPMSNSGDPRFSHLSRSTPPSPAATPPPIPPAVLQTAPAAPLQSSYGHSVVPARTYHPSVNEEKHDFPSRHLPVKSNTDIPLDVQRQRNDLSSSVSTDPPSRRPSVVKAEGRDSVLLAKDVAVFDEVVGFLSLALMIPILAHLFSSFDVLGDSHEAIRQRGGDPTSSGAIPTFWVGFSIELCFCAFALYDCTALAPGIPGFGRFDTTTLLFGYVDLNKASSILSLRALVWTLVCVMVSVTSEYASLSLAIGGLGYFICYFGLVRYSSLTHPWFPSFGSPARQSDASRASSSSNSQSWPVFLPVFFVNLGGACFALVAVALSVRNNGSALPMWSRGLLLFVAICCVVAITFQLMARLSVNIDYHLGSFLESFQGIYLVFLMLLLASISSGNSGVPPVAFLVVVILVLAVNALSYGTSTRQRVEWNTVKKNLKSLIAPKNWIRVCTVVSLLMVVYSGYIGFKSTEKDFWDADLDVNDDFIPDLDFSALQEPLDRAKEYVENLNLTLEYGLPDLSSLRNFPCSLNLGYFNRFIDLGDFDILKEGAKLAGAGIEYTIDAADFASDNLCNGIDAVQNFGFDDFGTDLFGIQSALIDVQERAEKYGQQMWAAMRASRTTIELGFNEVVEELEYSGEFLSNITSDFIGYGKNLGRRVQREVRGFNIRSFVNDLLEDLRDAFSFIGDFEDQVTNFVRNLEDDLSLWEAFDIGDLGDFLSNLIPEPSSDLLLDDKSRLFNARNGEFMKSLASYSREERMVFLESSFQSFMTEVDSNPSPRSVKRTKRQRSKPKKRNGVSSFVEYGEGLKQVDEKVKKEGVMKEHIAGLLQSDDDGPPTIECNADEIQWSNYSLDVTGIADDFDDCLCEILVATLAVSAVGFFIPGIGAPAQLIRNVARMAFRLLSALKTVRRAVSPIVTVTRNLNNVRSLVSRARTIQSALVASALTRYIIIIVPLLSSIFFVVYLAWQRRTKLSRAMYIQAAAMLLSMTVVGLLLLEAHRLVLSFVLDLGLATVEMGPNDGFHEAVHAHVILLVGLCFFLLSAVLFVVSERWERDGEDGAPVTSASAGTRAAGASGASRSSSESHNDEFNPQKPKPTIAAPPARKKSRMRRVAEWLTEARLSLIMFCAATIALSLTAAAMPWFDISATPGSSISELRTINSEFLEVIRSPLSDIEEMADGCTIDINLGDFFDFPQFDEIREGIDNAKQQIDDFADKIIPDVDLNIPDLSSLAQASWKVALVAVPLIGAVLILITTVVKKNFLSPTQVLFGAVLNLVTSTLILNNLPGFVSDITDSVPLYNLDLEVKDGYFYAFLAHGALWVCLCLLVVDLVAKIRWDEIEDDEEEEEESKQVPVKRGANPAIRGDEQNVWSDKKSNGNGMP